MKVLNNIVILGGGTSGWLSAAYLAKKLKDSNSDIDITLVESSDIPTIGVGEATIPNIVDTLQELEIDEYEFMRACSATFKQSIKFVAWNDNQDKSGYYHNFTTPLDAEKFDYAQYWLNFRTEITTPYAQSCTIQGQLCDDNIAPKRLEYGPYRSPLHYAYHFDAGQFAMFLRDYAKKKGVKHQLGEVEEVALSNAGEIDSLILKCGNTINAELYIDCSGFSALLIEQKLGSEFIPLNDILFVDKAVAAQIPYDKLDQPINSATISTAQECGWTWDIGLTNRRGTGYVYSSKYSSAERAEEVLLEYLKEDAHKARIRHLDIRVGYRKEQWLKNCVAIGLSSGFVEPLESTGIYLVEIALKTLINLLPSFNHFDSAASQYNALMTSQYEGIVDFIKLHYFISKRRDTDFWRDNTDPKTCPDSLLRLLDRCKDRAPNPFDLPIGPQCFTIYSYYAVMYGMEYFPDKNDSLLDAKYMEQARQIPDKVSSILNNARADLPTHRALIDQINRL